MSSPSHVRIELSPKAGFCIKSVALSPAVLPPPPQPPSPAKSGSALLEPKPSPIQVSNGQKIFVNIAWDPNVPPPPEGSEDAIQRAMQGEEIDEANPSGWYVPVIVSNARPDTDKSGKLSLVFDCIYNSTVKSRTLRDPEFKIFLVELALQRIEAQTGLTLSRNIGTPNIASKGKLLPRSVQIPASMVPTLLGAPSTSTSDSNTKGERGDSISSSTTPQAKRTTPLIQEISSSGSTAPNENQLRADGLFAPTPKQLDPKHPSSSSASDTGSSKSSLPGLKGILKKPDSGATTNGAATSSIVGPDKDNTNTPLEWSWKKDDDGRLRIDVRVPGLTPSLVQESTLDIESRRLILAVPNRRTLDIDLDLSDAEIVARIAAVYASSTPASTSPIGIARIQEQQGERPMDIRKEEETNITLKLKRQRDFEVDGADAEWKVGTGTVTIFV